MNIKKDILRCSVCNNIVEVLREGDGEIICCGKVMFKEEVKNKDEGMEKHLPLIKEKNGFFEISVGEVEHPMTKEHHIEWIEINTDKESIKKFFNINEKPIYTLSKSYKIKSVRAYCNIHGLWRRMNLDEIKREDLILFALKNEIDSMILYNQLSERIKNAFLKERLKFLANEEEKHKKYFEEFYKKTYLKEIVLPVEDIIPLPKVDISTPNKPLSDILYEAMESELAAHNFYQELSRVFADDQKTSKMLKFFSSMEMIHYSILQLERENSLKFEDYSNDVPMIHVGP
ncbi:MAG: desulfoferrodoxin family protein [candidate division WOR-3 bacterium]